jgi:hypothetical protein
VAERARPQLGRNVSLTRSGVQLEGEHGYVWTVRDGQAVRFRWFQSHREALDAARIVETRVINLALVALSGC